LRIGGLQPFEFLHQAIEFGVADLGCVQHVVQVLVSADGAPKLFGLLLKAGRTRSHANRLYCQLAMKKAVLIYNPASGRKNTQRAEQIAGAADVLRASGVEVETCPTTSAGSAMEQTQQCIASGADTVIACGGDGTINEVLNGLMAAGGQATLGVIPLGS